jgi:hypothetical protein
MKLNAFRLVISAPSAAFVVSVCQTYHVCQNKTVFVNNVDGQEMSIVKMWGGFQI